MLKNCDSLVEEVLDMCEGIRDECLFEYIQGIKEMEEDGFLSYNFCEIKEHE